MPIQNPKENNLPRLKIVGTLKVAKFSLIKEKIWDLVRGISKKDESLKEPYAKITIKNFGKVDKFFFRGSQPKKNEYRILAELGVNTVIDLQIKTKHYEKEMVESLGIKYVNIPMSDKEYPPNISIEKFLKLVNDSSTGVFYVHCAGGRHRTGVIGAIYRYTKYGWDFETVYKEMKKFGFYTRWGHHSLKEFVIDYRSKIKGK
jgi:protein tyrosine/serine phosphatase